MTVLLARARTLRLDLSFDGTDFLGWQRQPEGRTVQAEVEAALARCGARARRVERAQEIVESELLVVPGVGTLAVLLTANSCL